MAPCPEWTETFLTNLTSRHVRVIPAICKISDMTFKHQRLCSEAMVKVKLKLITIIPEHSSRNYVRMASSPVCIMAFFI